MVAALVISFKNQSKLDSLSAGIEIKSKYIELRFVQCLFLSVVDSNNVFLLASVLKYIFQVSVLYHTMFILMIFDLKLVVVEEIPPFHVKCFKCYINVTKYYYYYYYLKSNT